MSAGSFVRKSYRGDDGQNYPIRVQPETLLATFGTTVNVAPTSPPDAGLPSVRVTGGKRRYGIRARGVVITFPTAAPDGYKVGSYIRLPVLLDTVWNGISKYQAVTYLGATGEVVSKYREELK